MCSFSAVVTLSSGVAMLALGAVTVVSEPLPDRSWLELWVVDAIGVLVAPVSLVTAGEEEMGVGVDVVRSADDIAGTWPSPDSAGVTLALLKLVFSIEDGSEAAFHQLSKDIVDLGNTVVLPAEDNSVERAVLSGAGAGV